MTNNDADTLFRLTQDEIREAVDKLYDTKPDPWIDNPRGQKAFDVEIIAPMGWALPIHMLELQCGDILFCANDLDLREITSFRRGRPMEAEALDLFCNSPVRLSDKGLSMICPQCHLLTLAPLFVLVIQKIYAALKLRNLESFND